MQADDLDTADRVMRLAFGTMLGLPDPSAAFGDRDLVRTRFHAAPDCAWVAELAGEVVGSVFATRWGSFAFLGPLTVDPSLWDRGIAGRLLRPVLDTFARWDLRQAGLFTSAGSAKHLGLYQKHGFWPGPLTVVTVKETRADARFPHALVGTEREAGRAALLDEIRGLTQQLFPGLDVSGEIVAVTGRGRGDAVLVRREDRLDGVAVCHCGPGSEAGSDTCYVKFAAVRPGGDAPERFHALLAACEAHAADAGLGRLVAGVNTGRLDAYRRLLARGFRTEQIGVSMLQRPDGPHFNGPGDYVLDDLR